MKVKCTDIRIAGENGDFTLNRDYEVIEVLEDMYCLIDDIGDRNYVNKSSFETVKEANKEVWILFEDCDILGVFASKEKAKEFKEKRGDTSEYTYEIQRFLIKD